MSPPTSRSGKRKCPVYTSDEDEGVPVHGSAVANSEMDRSRGVSGSTTPRRRLDRPNTPRIVSTSSSSRRSHARQRVDETGAAAGWRERRSHSTPRDTVQEDGSGEYESDVGSARGMSGSLAVPALPCRRFDRSHSNRSASPSVSAGVTQREQVAEDAPVIADHNNERQGRHGEPQRKDQTEGEKIHLQNPSHLPRTLRPVTPIQASSATLRVAAVQSDRRSQESTQPPRNTASLAAGPPSTVRAGSPGVVPRRSPTQDPANSRPHYGPSHNATSSSSLMSVGTNHYPGAHDFSIREQHITTNNIGSSKTLFDFLDPHVAHGAAHNSNDRRDAPACHEETRVALRENIVGWIKDDGGDDEPKLMWLSGPAGSGKSAIAGSVATTCEDEGLLAGTFFFSSFSPSMDRRWSRGLIATLVHHMSQHDALGQFRATLLQALERRPDIFHKTLKEQAICLILEPFCAISDHKGRTGWPRAVIIDGVDEVVAPLNPSTDLQRVQRTPEDDQVEVLDVLLTLSLSPHFPFQIFVASRPERNITDFFDEPTVHRFTLPLFLDSNYDPDTDIERLLWSKFAQIRRRFRLSDASWPGQGAVDRIVEMSSGQFIVPTTVIRWVESGMPKQQLDEVLKLQRDNTGSKNPFESLDALYHYILMRARTPDGDAHLVVKWVIAINSSMSLRRDHNHEVIATPAKFWRSFMEDEEGELDYRLAPISSLISIPPPNDTKSPITFYHKSLIDYLSNPTRCSDLYVGKEEVDSFVSGRIVAVLKYMGPRVRLLPPQRLDDFLSSLLGLRLVGPLKDNIFTGGALLQHTATFLNHLRCEELDTLASCNVAWWAKSLTQQPGIRVDLSSFVRAISLGIHRASKCIDLPGHGDLSARQAAQE